MGASTRDGFRDMGGFWAGALDEIRLYNRGLTADEVACAMTTFD